MTGLQKKPRIGANMRQACAYVAAHPGCSIIKVARHLYPADVPGPASPSGGFKTVHRCIDAGLIRSRPPKRQAGDRSPYQLEITAAGYELASREALWPRRAQPEPVNAFDLSLYPSLKGTES
jgi:hypothetical protein